MEADLYLWSFAALAGATAAFAITPRALSGGLYGLLAASAAALGAACLNSLFSGAGFAFALPAAKALEFSFAADGLSAFFGLILSILSFAVSVYAAGYARHAENPSYQGVFYGLFLLSMYCVFFSSNVLAFLVSWEAMSIASYFLVVSDAGSDESRRAGLLYATMTHIGTALIMAAFMLAYAHTGSMDFAGMKAGLAGGPGGDRSVIFVLSFLGFGIKAGIVPLHIWLPRAHPAAPSHVSALMSGVMIKTGIYGIVRMGVDVLSAGAGWWGLLVLAAGALSSVIGILYALMERDMKRLLAYSSVENIGIILLGVGASMIFSHYGQAALAGLALAAGLYHTLNHALFKGLLFMGAGSVLHGAGTRDMEKMGGLLKRMPWTGLFFLVGSVSICALPPMNGFASEWLTYQALVLGSTTPAVHTRVFTLLAGAALALTGALSADCFIKAFGISFLGMPRSEQAEGAVETSFSMKAGMAALAASCLILGVFPGYVLLSISRIGAGGLHLVEKVGMGSSFLVVEGGFSSLSPLALMTLSLSALAVLAAIVRAANRGRRTSYGDSWDCGIRRLTPRMQYTATAFTKPLRVIFKNIYLPTREVKITYRLKPFFAKDITHSSEITPFFERYAYDPAIRAIHLIAGRVRKLQSGSLHLYLGYILITLLILLFAWG